MRAPHKKNESKFDSETTVVTEEVVLGAAEGNVPTSLVIDESGLLDAEKFSETDAAQSSADDSADNKDEKKGSRFSIGLISGLLNFLRRPENWLLRRYYESAVRNKLLNRFDWYRDFECEAQLTNKMGNLYGTNSPLSHFFKNNILASLIIIAISGKLIVNYVTHPAENRYAEKVEEPTQVLADTAPEPDYSHILNHCAVTDGLRGLYGETDSRQLRNEVITEVKGFIKVYNTSEIEQWYADQENKRGAVISQVQSILPRIQRYREQIAAEIDTDNLHRAQLVSELNSVSGAGSRGLRDINESIKLRNQLTELETQMEKGPNQKYMGELDTQLERLDLIISGDERLSRPVSDWARTISEQDKAALIDSVRDAIDKDIDTNIAQSVEGSPEAKQYRLRILIATLSHLGDLIRQLKNSPNYFEVNVDHRQRLTNGRLYTLFGGEQQSSVELLNYDNCLTALNTTQSKFTAH